MRNESHSLWPCLHNHLFVLSFLIPRLFCFSIVKARKTLTPVLLGPSEKIWLSSPHLNEPQESHSKPQKGRLGRLTDAPPTLLPQTCWTAMLELHDICLSITKESEFQEPQRTVDNTPARLMDCSGWNNMLEQSRGNSENWRSHVRGLAAVSHILTTFGKLPSSSISLSVEVSLVNLRNFTRSCKTFVCTLAVSPPSFVSPF